MIITNEDCNFEDGKVYRNMKIKYIQNGDGNSDNVQELDLSEEDCGGGKYFVLSTERWSFDKLEDLIIILNDYVEKNK